MLLLRRQSGEVNLHLILTIFLAFGMVIFGVLAVVAYNQNTTTQDNHNQLVASAVQKATTKQKEIDSEANRKAGDLPYKTYTASGVDGGFQLQIPKSWSIYAAHNPTGTTQLDLAANPNVVDYTLPNNTGTSALKLQLLRTSVQETVKNYDQRVKKKQLTSKGITVSGISGTWLEGQIDEQRHNGVVIILAVRDKTMIISTQDRTYLDEFNKIISTAKITP